MTTISENAVEVPDHLWITFFPIEIFFFWNCVSSFAYLSPKCACTEHDFVHFEFACDFCTYYRNIIMQVFHHHGNKMWNMSFQSLQIIQIYLVSFHLTSEECKHSAVSPYFNNALPRSTFPQESTYLVYSC